MHKCTSSRKFFTPGLRLLLFLFENNRERFAKLQCETQFERSYFTTPRGVSYNCETQARGTVILNLELHYFDEDEISTESSLLKVFLPVRLIHRFTSPFQLRQLIFDGVATCCCRKKKKKKAGKQGSYWQCPRKRNVLCYTIVPAHDYTVHISLANLFSCNLF